MTELLVVVGVPLVGIGLKLLVDSWLEKLSKRN